MCNRHLPRHRVFRHERIAPDGVDQFVLLNQPPAIFQQEHQNLTRLRFEREFHSGLPNLEVRRRNAHIVKFKNFVISVHHKTIKTREMIKEASLLA
jgi:hypothetical protein